MPAHTPSFVASEVAGWHPFSGSGRLDTIGSELSASRRQPRPWSPPADAAGHQVDVDVMPTIADGMAGDIEPGSITVNIIRDNIAQLNVVTEDEIRAD